MCRYRFIYPPSLKIYSKAVYCKKKKQSCSMQYQDIFQQLTTEREENVIEHG